MASVLERLRGKHLHWLAGYARHRVRRLRHDPVRGPRHLLFALCDHFEPLHGQVDAERGRARMGAWSQAYPVLCKSFRDSTGRPPRHSFFFPAEQYAPEYLDALARLAAAGLGEVEVHLHHDNDTPATLRTALGDCLRNFSAHGHLSRGADGKARFAFIHGNWCLANSRRDKRLCGVDAEIPILHELGCYADFTFPSAPDETQPRIVNRVYWPTGDLEQARAYERGEPARVGHLRRDRILMIQGPLGIARVPRPGHLSIGIETGNLSAVEPGNLARVRAWIAENIHVLGRPEWVFIKVHTHGAPEPQAASLLGDGGRALHEALAQFNDGERYVLHYTTAREMYNIAIAAMEGKSGNPSDFRDHVLPAPPAATQKA
jgi:hypothetical protein